VPKAIRETKVIPEHKDQQGPRETKEKQVPQVLKAIRATKEIPEPLVQPGLKEYKE
jgi:hypothetical protein